MDRSNIKEQNYSSLRLKIKHCSHCKVCWRRVRIRIHSNFKLIYLTITNFIYKRNRTFAWANVVSIDDNDHIFGILRDKQNNYELSIYTIYNEPNIRLRALHDLPDIKGTFLRVDVNNDPLSLSIYCTK